MAASVFNWKNKLLMTVIFLLAIVAAEQPDYDDNLLASNYFDSYKNFLTKNNTRVLAQIGGTALLPCTVRLSSNPATVSWLKRKHHQLLTVGLYTHIVDERFVVEHVRHMGHWALKIKNVEPTDKGTYECQLSVHPVESIFIELNVVEPIAEISGSPDIHIDEGSTLRLECKLKKATEQPSYMFWYHNDKMVNYELESEGYSVSTFELPNTSRKFRSSSKLSSVDQNDLFDESLTSPLVSQSLVLDEEQYIQFQNQPHHLALPITTSVLTIKEAHFKHAGNYTCVPSNTKSTSVTIHVLKGEKPAAMQHANRSIIDIAKSDSNKLVFNRIRCSLFSLVIIYVNFIYQINR